MPLKFDAIDGKQIITQTGYICCDEYYCSERCLNQSFAGLELDWHEHYIDSNECYWTEWELETQSDIEQATNIVNKVIKEIK